MRMYAPDFLTAGLILLKSEILIHSAIPLSDGVPILNRAIFLFAHMYKKRSIPKPDTLIITYPFIK